MIRHLTAGWVPYSTWTERGSFRHCLINPDALQLPPSPTSEALTNAYQPISRRQMLNYSVAGATACGVIAYMPQKCDAAFSLFGIGIEIAKKILVPSLKYFLREVIYTAAEVAGRFLATKVIEYCGLGDDEFRGRLVTAGASIVQARGPEAEYHALQNDSVQFSVTGADALKIPIAASKKFVGSSIGLDRVQWEIETNVIEKHQMDARKSPFVPLSFRRKGYHNALNAKFKRANELYTSRKLADRPWTADEVVYTIPLRGEDGLAYTGFCVRRAGAENSEFIFV
jgi:hypothetical protein